MRNLTIHIALILMLFGASETRADFEVDSIIGSYQTLGDSNQLIAVNLKHDNSATIEIRENADDTVTAYPATWTFDGSNVTLSYTNQTETLEYHEKLKFKQDELSYGVSGLRVPANSVNSGIIGDVRLWKSAELLTISRYTRLILKFHGVNLSPAYHDIPVIIFLSPGLLVFLFGIMRIVARAVFLLKSLKADGVVCESTPLFMLIDRIELPSYIPLNRIPKVRFVAQDGNTYEFVQNLAAIWTTVRDRNKVSVLYKANNPRKAFINKGLIIWSGPSFVTLAGILITVALAYIETG